MRQRYSPHCTYAGQRELIGEEEAASGIGFGICATRRCFARRAFFCISVKEISGDNWCLAFSYKRSFFNQQAEIVAMEGEEYWPKLKASVQFEPGRAAVVASQHEHEPAAKTYIK